MTLLQALLTGLMLTLWFCTPAACVGESGTDGFDAAQGGGDAGGQADALIDLLADARSDVPTSGQPAYLSATWVRTGGPPGGLGYDIRIHPDDPDTMYVTDDGAGVFISTDGGLTWSPRNQGITTRLGPAGDSYPVFSLTIDPNDPDRIWIGTSGTTGIFRSDDGGQSWTRMTTGIQEQFATIRGFGVEPGNSDVVYVAGEVPSHEWNGEHSPGPGGLDRVRGMVYKSEDAGQSWRRVWTGDNLARYVLIDPENTDRIFVSTGIFDRCAADSFAEARDPGGVGILRSLDGGESWEALDEDNGIDPDELYFGSLFMHPENPDILLAASGNDPFQMVLGRVLGGVYLTEDGGETWTKTLSLGNASAVEICQGDPQVAYAASINGIYVSLDGGHTWEELGSGLWGPEDMAAGFPIDMQCDPRDAQRVFVNNYLGGNFVSTDGGTTWTLASQGYTGAKISAVAISSTDPARVFATARSGLFTSDRGGDDWRGLNRGAARSVEGAGVTVDPDDDQHLFVTFLDAGPNPLETRDGGQTWRPLETGMVGPSAEPGTVLELIYSPQDHQTLFGIVSTNHGCWVGIDTFACEASGGRGLIVSRDGGRTWARTDLSNGDVISLAIAPDPSGPAYASVYRQGLYRSDDHGQIWEQVHDNPYGSPGSNNDSDMPPAGARFVVALDPSDSERLYAGFSSGGVSISEDGGLTWTPSAAGMDPESSIVDFAVDAAHPGVVYAAAANGGVYYSTDSGRRWTRHNDGLTSRAATRLVLSEDGRVLYLGTQGGGVFRLGELP